MSALVTNSQAPLRFQHVGVLEQSLGAYTSLALAGSTVDLNTLGKSCPLDGGAHFLMSYNPQAVEESLPTPEVVIGPNPELAKRYVKVMSLAFFKTYLAEEEAYRQYLTPSYTAALSQPDIPLSLIREFTLEE